jgi:hypothetical protein
MRKTDCMSDRIIFLFFFGRRLRFKIGLVMENVWFRFFTLCLIIVDIVIVIVDLAARAQSNYHDVLEIASRCIISYFVLEVLLRIFYKG